jgi:hypothetical protein
VGVASGSERIPCTMSATDTDWSRLKSTSAHG